MLVLHAGDDVAEHLVQDEIRQLRADEVEHDDVVPDPVQQLRALKLEPEVVLDGLVDTPGDVGVVVGRGDVQHRLAKLVAHVDAEI